MKSRKSIFVPSFMMEQNELYTFCQVYVSIHYFRRAIAQESCDLLQNFLVIYYRNYLYTKSVRSVLATYLTILAFELAPSVKISNFEAHADMNINSLIDNAIDTLLYPVTSKGMRINTSRGHLPLHHLLLKCPSVRSLDCSDER